MTIELSEADKEDARRVIGVLAPLVDGLAEALFPRSEVVLHDLTRFPNTIAAIGGNITGRGVGGPPTDLGLRTFESGWNDHLIGYRTELSDGTPIRSSSLFLHGASGRAIACLCINADVSELAPAAEAVQRFLRPAVPSVAPIAAATLETELPWRPAGAEGKATRTPPERFPRSVDELTRGLLREAIGELDIPVDLMQKRHRLEVVRNLRARGFFAIRDAIELLAETLGVTRHTVYNYLTEVAPESSRRRHTS